MTTPAPAKEYNNTASIAVLSIPITATDPTATVTNYLGWPVPVDGVWAIIGRGTTTAEILLITNAAGNVLSIERGQDGTVATPHSAGDELEHIAPAVHFVQSEEHQAAIADIHGVTGGLVGASGPGTIRDKLFRGAFVSVHSDVEPPGITARFESVSDAPGDDGFVHRNTLGDPTARAFLSEQAGTPRFQVYNDGKVKLNPAGVPGLENAGTTKLDGNVTAGANVTVTGTVTGSDLAATDDVTVGDALTVTGLSTLGATTTGALTAASANVTGTLGVTGTSTLAAVNATSVAATGAVSAATVSATGAVTGASVAATGAVTAYGGRVLTSVSSLASVTSPTTGQLAHLISDDWIYRWSGSAWVPMERLESSMPHAHYRLNGTQSIPQMLSRKAYLSTALSTSAEVTATLGDATNGSYFTLNRAGVWLLVAGSSWVNNAGTFYRVAYLAPDTGPIVWAQDSKVGSGANDASFSFARRFAAGQRVALWAYQESGVAMNLVQNNEVVSLSMTWLGP